MTPRERRRVAAIAFFRLRVEIARAQDPGLVGVPLAVVVARRGGAVTDERSLLGNTRIDEVSPEAWALGVRPGSTIAAARARAEELRVRVVHADAVEKTLARVSEASLAFGATVAYDVALDAVWIDVTGCAHLHASAADAEGLCTLRDRIAERVRGLGHVARVAVATGPRIALGFARYGTGDEDDTSDAAFAALTVRALPLSDAALDWLRKLGVRTVGELRALPRAALGTRLGAESHDALALAAGEDAAPLTPYVPEVVPEERLDLEYGVTATEPLLFVAKALCDRLAARLDGRSMSATALELVLELDRAMVEEGSAARAAMPLALAAPIHHAVHLVAVLRARLESFAIEAPVRAVVLRATEIVPRVGKPLHLLEPEPRAERVLPQLTAELAADLGDDRVGVLELTDSWVPEKRTALVPLASRARRGGGGGGGGARNARRGAVDLVGEAVEPSRILSTPLPRPRAPLHAPRLLARTEGVEWWRAGRRVIDHVAAWLDGVEAVAWLEVDTSTGKATVRGWLD